MQTPQVVLDFLRAQRRQAAVQLAGMQDCGTAVCEVLDELIRRAQVIADEYPATGAMTVTTALEAPAVLGALRALMGTVGALADLIDEAVAAIQDRRTPLLRFVERLEAEGFVVTDGQTVVAGPVAPRADIAEQAAAHQERLTEMGAAIAAVTGDHAQRVRNLIPSVLDGGSPGDAPR